MDYAVPFGHRAFCLIEMFVCLVIISIVFLAMTQCQWHALLMQRYGYYHAQARWLTQSVLDNPMSDLPRQASHYLPNPELKVFTNQIIVRWQDAGHSQEAVIRR